MFRTSLLKYFCRETLYETGMTDIKSKLCSKESFKRITDLGLYIRESDVIVIRILSNSSCSEDFHSYVSHWKGRGKLCTADIPTRV